MTELDTMYSSTPNTTIAQPTWKFTFGEPSHYTLWFSNSSAPNVVQRWVQRVVFGIHWRRV